MLGVEEAVYFIGPTCPRSLWQIKPASSATKGGRVPATHIQFGELPGLPGGVHFDAQTLPQEPLGVAAAPTKPRFRRRA
uniref:Uncharacterized protein n=1 Tax=mine drainage metagenome TaxID=410659 RepID=E6PSW5_9ZZZZ